MQWVVVGLGNPEEQYTGTRHNVGRDFVLSLADKLPSKPKIVTPEFAMNHSGKAVAPLIKSAKAAAQLVVVHDELDLPLGRVKLSFGSSAGGHRGVESIQKAVKTKDFVRVRVGISPTTPGGKLKKPVADDVVDFVLGKFKPSEKETLKKVKKTVEEALVLVLTEGRERAMNEINTK